MKPHQKLIAKVRALTDADNEALPRWQRALLYAADLSRLGAAKLREDRASQMAAALTYHTLFSLLPTLVLTLVVAQSFVSERELDQLKGQAVSWAVKWLDSDGRSPTDAAPPIGEQSAAHQVEGVILDGVGRARPDGFAGLFSRTAEAARRAAERRVDLERRSEYALTADKLDEQFQQWLDQLQDVDFRSIGIVGVLLFIYGATKLLSTIESSFNFVLRASENRSWYIRLPLYYTTITLAPLVLLAGQWVQRRFLELLDSGGSVTAWIVAPLGYLSPLITTWLVLLLAYRLLPNATLRLRSAAIGSFMAAVLLGVAVQGFAFYVRGTGSTSLYGALALLPLFLLLLWIIWQIVLFGLEVATVLQIMPGQRNRRGRKPQHPALVDPRMLVPAMAVVGEHFERGESVTAEQLADRLNLPNAAVTTMIDALMRQGHLHAVEGESRRVTLARPPARIALSDLLTLALRLGRGTQTDSPQALSAFDAAERDAASHRSLADLL